MIIDGKKISLKIYENLKQEIKNSNKKYKLVAILVGENSPSLRYIKQKEKWANYVGIDFELINFKNDVKEEEILEKINFLNNDKETTAFMVQLPLFDHINTQKIINAINPLKDADGFSPINIGKVVLGDKEALEPCTPAGIMELLKEYKIDLVGKNVVVIGRSNIVGKPLANLLINSGATVTVCNSKTKNLEFFTKNAQIVIVAVGKKHLLKADMINKNTVVIDVGFSVFDGKIFGDCDFENIEKQGNLITPVPGGVGPMTVAMLMSNVVKAGKLQEKI